MTRSADSIASRIAVAGASLVVLALGAHLVFGPEPRLAHLFYDDAFYYLQVARNLASGVGSTFDGIHPTNGYHPLWCYLLVPLFWATDDPGLAMRISAVLWFLFAAAVPPAIAWALRPRTGRWGSALAAILTLHPFLVLHLVRPSGLETPLYALLLALFVGAFERSFGAGDEPSPRRALGLGVLLGAVILARVDAGLFAVAAAALLAARAVRPPRAPLRSLLLVAVGATVVAGPSLAWNTWRFGSPMPISGRAVRAYQAGTIAEMGGEWSTRHLRYRAGFAAERVPLVLAQFALRDSPLEEPVRRSGKPGAIVILAVCGAWIVTALRRRSARGPLATDALALLTAGTALHYLVYAGWFWSGGEALFRLYYFMPEGLLLAAATGAVLGPTLERRIARPAWRAAVILLVWIGMAGHLVVAARASYAEAPDAREPMVEHHLYGWIRRNLPGDAVLAAVGSGRLGYFVGRPVVNLDGLINGTEYLDALRRDDTDTFLFRTPVRFVIAHRGPLHGFDVARPEIPPSPRVDIGETLYRLASRHGCTLREIPGTPDTSVVVEILRP